MTEEEEKGRGGPRKAQSFALSSCNSTIQQMLQGQALLSSRQEGGKAPSAVEGGTAKPFRTALLCSSCLAIALLFAYSVSSMIL